jgi:ketosteroid isomerase-like protein
VEIYCAECGCLVDRGVRLISCDTPNCCCVDLPLTDALESLAARLRHALNEHDLDAFRKLLAEDAQWGEGSRDDERTCRNRTDIIARYERLLHQGVCGTVTETATGPGGIVCLIEITWPDDAPNRRGAHLYQVFLVTDGLITRITGNDNRELALAAIAE